MKRRCVVPIHRSGSMLIELCASLATASMVMLLGVTLIERSMHWTQAVHRHTNLQRELSQLARTWREDCLKADQITFESELAERDVSTVWVHARVDKLKLWVAFLNSFFYLLPVNFELFVFVNFCVI